MKGVTVKILGLCGSPRKGATEYALGVALDAAAEIKNVETEQINLRGKKLNYCLHCGACEEKNTLFCPVFDDDITKLYDKILSADGLILASPVYHMGVSALLQTVFQRLKPLGKFCRQGRFSLKVGAGIAVGGRRNGGQETTLVAINNIMLSLSMINLSGGVFAYNGAAVWSNDRKGQGVKDDIEGTRAIKVIGRRVAVLATLLNSTFSNEENIFSKAQLMGFANEADRDEGVYAFYHRSANSWD